MENYTCELCHKVIENPSFVYFRNTKYEFIKHVLCNECNSKVSTVIQALVETKKENV